MLLHSPPARNVTEFGVDINRLLTDVSFGVNCQTSPDGRVTFTEPVSELDDATAELLTRFVTCVDVDMRATATDVQNEELSIRHGIRMRTGGRNLLPFAHIDLPGSGMRDKVVDLLDRPGQYVLTSGAEMRQFPGNFWLPNRLRRISGVLVGFSLLNMQALFREGEELADDTIHHLSTSTVHAAARRRDYKGKNRLFVGDYARWIES